MSKLDTLIAELCPDGVEYKQVWQITTWDKRFNGVDSAKQPAINPHHYYLAKELQQVLAEQGDIKVLTTSPTSLYTNEDLVDESHIRDGEIVAIPGGGNAVVQYYRGRYITSDNRIAMVNTESIMTKFLFYVLKSREEELSSYYRGAGIKHPEMSKVLAMEIPAPPIEVQREIIRILDTFAALTDTLTKELDCRRQQYAYYRDRLLSQENLEALDGKPVEMKRLDEISISIKAGGDVPDDTVKGQTEPTDTHPYPVFSNGSNDKALYGYCSKYSIKKESVTISARGSIGFHSVRKPYFTPVVRLITVTPDVETITSAYLDLALTQTCISGDKGGIPQLTIPKVKGIEIPVPSLATQQKVVDILERFDALTASLTDGIPAEIEARRAQYAYYRDRLLDFPRKAIGTE